MSTPKTERKSSSTAKSRKKKTAEESKKPNPRNNSLNHSSDSSSVTTQVSSTPSTPTGDVLRDSLKIKIKLSPNVTVPPIYLFPTDQLADVKTGLQPFFHKSGDYSEDDLKQLQVQLETSKAVVAGLARAFSQQIDALESWKASLQGGIPSQVTELRPWRDNIFDRDEDDEVDVEGEADVDVVAMDLDESADGSTRADDYFPDNSFSKSRASSDHQTKMAQLIRRRTQPQGASRHKKITKAATLPAAAGTPDHRKRRGDSEVKDLKRKAESDLADVPEDSFLNSDEEEEKIIRHAPSGPNSFWVAMDAYFRAVTDNDLAFLTPKADRPDDPAYHIPPLGTHYHQLWAAEDAELGEKRANRANSRVAKTEEGSEAEDEEVYVGDLTQRLLASMLEEQAVVSSQPPSPNVEEDSKDLAMTAVPIHNYSQAYMTSLEERIRLELCSIGLMDATEEMEGSDKDDDELCSELRQLQTQLREQTIANNERKLKLLALVKVKMVEQEQQRKQKAANVVIEKQYESFIKKKKKRKGSRPLNVQDTGPLALTNSSVP